MWLKEGYSMTSSSFHLSRLRITKSGKPVYDQQFHKGVNIIRGENSSGKSTIADFIFYILGGEFHDWKTEAKRCDEILAEVITKNGVVTLKRKVNDNQTPIDLFYGSMVSAYKSSSDQWRLLSIRRSKSGKESFSQLMFRACGIPEAISQESSNITMHQILRLVYSDQRTPASRIFRYDSVFDSKEIRAAVADLMCGVSVYDHFEQELKLRSLLKQYDILNAKYDKLFASLPKGEKIANLKSYNAKLSELNDEIVSIVEEIKNVDEFISDTASDDFINKRNGLRKSLTKYSIGIRALENSLETLDFETIDILDFQEHLKTSLEKLNQTATAADVLGMVDFVNCPSCLLPLDADVEKHKCKVCGKDKDIDDEKSHFLKIKQDLEIQLRETGQLIQQKRAMVLSERKDLKTKRKSYKVMLRNFSINYDQSNSPREAFLGEKHGRLGQIEKEIDLLENYKSVVEKLGELSKEKMEVQGDIDLAEGSLKALVGTESKRRKIVDDQLSNLLIGNLKLSERVKRQVEFRDPQTAKVYFNIDALEVGGVANFSESSNVILKNSAILSIFQAACNDDKYFHPKFLLFDNIEDKGMEPERSHNFQQMIVDASKMIKTDHQIIMTTSLPNPKLEVEKYTIGPAYSESHKTLEFTDFETI